MTTRIPPGPKGHWLKGNLPEFKRDRLDFWMRCHREFGDIVKVRMGPRRLYFLYHPDLVEEVLVHKNHLFMKHFALRMSPLVLGKGLLTSEGEFWLRQRRLVQPVFQKNRIASYAPAMVSAAEKLIADWKDGEPRDLATEMSKLTLAIAAKVLFDAEVGGEAQVIVAAMKVLQDHFLQRFTTLLPTPVWLPTPSNLRFKAAVRRLDDILYGFIRQRRESKVERGDLLSLLLRARDEGNGKGMSDRQVRDEAMTLFLAGHETTALGLSWTWFLLSQHAAVEKRLWEEWGQVLGGRTPTVDDLPKLTYTEKVIQESMRLYPPAYVVGREALEDCTIGGYHVPRGMTLMMSQWVIHRDGRFFPEPEAFRPERWEEPSIHKLPKFAYFPFGGGPRLCIGNTFAMMEMVLVLATMGQRYSAQLQHGAQVTPQATFTLRTFPGVPAILRRRG